MSLKKIKEWFRKLIKKYEEEEEDCVVDIDLCNTKYQWMVTRKGDFLHFVPGIPAWSKAYWAKYDDQFNDFRWTTACGLKVFLSAPGIFSRLSTPRCEECCHLIGITKGKGCPINDDSCVLTNESDTPEGEDNDEKV